MTENANSSTPKKQKFQVGDMVILSLDFKSALNMGSILRHEGVRGMVLTCTCRKSDWAEFRGQRWNYRILMSIPDLEAPVVHSYWEFELSRWLPE